MFVLGGIEQDLSRSHKLAEWLFRKMANDLWQMSRGGYRKAFEIPEHLARTWGLRPN
jgi:hypothetical protein